MKLLAGLLLVLLVSQAKPLVKAAPKGAQKTGSAQVEIEDRVPFTINGKKVTADKVRLGSKEYVPALIAKPNVNVTGKIAKVEGLWWGPSEESKGFGIVKIAPKVQGRKPEMVFIDTDVVFTDFELRNDVKVTIYGPVQPLGHVQAWLVDVAPPGLQWACELQNPGAIVSGQDQTFTVNIAVKNTGQQAFVSVEGAVRLWQTESPNDVVEKVTIPNLLPGETRTMAVPITIFNYQFIGKTSLPKCAFTITNFE